MFALAACTPDAPFGILAAAILVLISVFIGTIIFGIANRYRKTNVPLAHVFFSCFLPLVIVWLIFNTLNWLYPWPNDCPVTPDPQIYTVTGLLLMPIFMCATYFILLGRQNK